MCGGGLSVSRVFDKHGWRVFLDVPGDEFGVFRQQIVPVVVDVVLFQMVFDKLLSVVRNLLHQLQKKRRVSEKVIDVLESDLRVCVCV